MLELGGLAAGVAWGVAGHRLRGTVPLPRVLAGALATGVAVSLLSGELAVSWAFALFDAAQTLLATLCALALAAALDRRRGLRMRR